MASFRIAFVIKSQSLLTRRLASGILQDAVACLSTGVNQRQINTHIFSVGSQNCRNNNTAGKISNSLTKRIFSSSSGSSENDKGIQVYEGRVKGLMKKVKIFSLTTSFIGLVGQPYLWYSVQDMSLLLAAPMFTAINFFVFANPLMIHYLAKRYVLELYYKPDTETYTATVLSLFARKQSFSYTAKDVVIPEIPGLFSMLTVKGRPIFIHHEDFTSIEIYKKMMGFDKPLDLTYAAESAENKEK